MEAVQPKLYQFVTAWIALILLLGAACVGSGPWRVLLGMAAALGGGTLWCLGLGGEFVRALLGPLAQYVPWVHLQVMLWRQHWQLHLKVQLVRWFLKPYAPMFHRLSRNQVFKGAHRRGLYLKSSTKKHMYIQPRVQTPYARRRSDAPSSLHKLLVWVGTCLLLCTAVSAGHTVGYFASQQGDWRLADMQHGARLTDWYSVNLQHLAAANLPYPLLSRRLQQRGSDRAAGPDDAPDPSRVAARVSAAVADEPAGADDGCPVNPASFACTTPFTPDGPEQPSPHVQYDKDPVNGWSFGSHPDCTPAQRQKLQDVLLAHKEQFAYSMNDLTGYVGTHPPFRINLTDDLPTISAQRRYSPAEVEIRKAKREELVAAGVCVDAPPGCKWASCPTMPSKKNADGLWTDKRFCCDYRWLNNKTVHDYYGLHLPEDLYYQVCRSRVFSILDLRSCFHQLPVHPDDQPKTAWWDGNRLLMYTRTPFGVRCAPAHAQRVLDHEIQLNGLTECCAGYIDDLLGHSATVDEHIDHIRQILEMLKKCGLKAHPDKCHFMCDTIEYLGHQIGPGGLTPHASKVATIRELRTPTNVHELKSMLGFCNYYRVYLPGYSTICAPLNELLKKDVPWEWTAARADAYQQLKDGLCKEGNALKRFDTDQSAVETTVYCDWSGVGIGAVLAQRREGGDEYMVACISRSLNKHERNYSSYAGEMLACVWAVKSFRMYLHGTPFKICTDHQPLTWLMGTPDLHGKHCRWAMSLQEFEMLIVHRPGAEHQNVDVPSRFPLATSYDATGACLDPEVESGPELGCTPTAEPLAADHPAALLALVPTPVRQQAAEQRAALHAVMGAAPVADFMDTYTYATCDPLQGDMGTLCDVAAPEPVLNGSVESISVPKGRGLVSQHFRDCQSELAQLPFSRVQPLVVVPGQAMGRDGGVQQLSTKLVGRAVFDAAMREGITLYEPFGGMCSGLDSMLGNGYTIARYLYSDIDPAAVKVARHRIASLHARYPLSFPLSASRDTFTALPADVVEVSAAHLDAAGAGGGDQWLVVAGWSCQDLSRGGKGRGLDGIHSVTFYDILRILGDLQALQQQRPPGFILENTYMQDSKSKAVQDAFTKICHAVGQPVVVDAARFGSYAHRLRNFWSNLADPVHVNHMVSTLHRSPGRFVDDVLDNGRQVAFYAPVSRPPRYQCDEQPDEVGGELKPVQALPTLMATIGSYAFRESGPGPFGMIRDKATQKLSEPNVEERERIMGFRTGCTAAPGVTWQQRHAVTGRAMDRYTTLKLFGIYAVLSNFSVPLNTSAASWRVVHSPWHPQMCPNQLDQPTNINNLDGSIHGKGAAVMSRMGGWVPGQHLGLHAPTALHTPLEVPLRPHGDRVGIGFSPDQPSQSVSRRSHHSRRLQPVRFVAAADVQRGGDPGEPIAVSLSAALAGLSITEPESCSPTAEPNACKWPEPFPIGPSPHEVVVENASCFAAALQTEQVLAAEPGAALDVWDDLPVLAYLADSEKYLAGHPSPAEKKRVCKRAKVYSMRNGVLYRVMPNGSSRVCPPIASRAALVVDTHARCGHFGMHRTEHQLQAGFWWAGMRGDVRQVVSNCEACSQMGASFGRQGKELQPLSIEGYMYRWGCDLAGPFERSALGNEYAMIAIEYFSKQIEIIAIPNKTAEVTAAAFLSHVICRYGAPAEVVTDGGSEFKGAFDALLEEALVTHRVTSPNHPQADGLAERAVQTMKRSLSKLVHDRRTVRNWDQEVQWVALGYRASKQNSTHLSPYNFLFGTEPVIPPAIKPRLEEPELDFASPEVAADYLLQRGALLKQHCLMAMNNLRIAQQRDSQQYQRIRSGSHRPALAEFSAGDLVHVRRSNIGNTLQSAARPGVYQVVEARESGVLIVRGCCGHTMAVHLQNCAPCHLANIDLTINPSARLKGVQFLCSSCETPDDEGLMLICDSCGKGWHTYCVQLDAVPPEPLWICPVCTAAGVTPLMVEMQQQIVPDKGPGEVQFRTVKQQLADEQAQLLNGVWITEMQKGQAVHGQLQFIHREDRGGRPRQVYKFVVNGQDPDRRIAYEAALAMKHKHDRWMAARQADPDREAAGPPLSSAVFVTTKATPKVVSSAVIDWSRDEEVQAAHQLYVGRPAAAAQIVALQQLVAAPPVAPAPVLPAEVALLLSAVDLNSCAKLLCPWAADDVLQQALHDRYRRNLVMPAQSELCSMWSPRCYQAAAMGAEVDWVFITPPAGLEFLVLAMAVKHARLGVSMLVDAAWLHEGQDSLHGSAAQYLLAEYKKADRLALIHPADPGRVWVVVFAAVGHRTGMLSMLGSTRQGWIVL